MISIDARGLRNPEHIRAFRDRFEGICAVFEDVELLIDDHPSDLKRLEMYLRSCRAHFNAEKRSGHIMVHIQQPFYLCG
ncbi:MAG TPA: hypothetical protein VK445_04055 [Dissulfurispiraceae bacterium]|nr:hypothetical protein [Dissulfurispiraceae bacterium]